MSLAHVEAACNSIGCIEMAQEFAHAFEQWENGTLHRYDLDLGEGGQQRSTSSYEERQSLVQVIVKTVKKKFV